MNAYVRATPRIGPNGTSPRPTFALAGSARVWFDEVSMHDGVGGWSYHCAADLPQDVLSRLSDARADLCGLQMDRPRIMGIVNVTPDSFSDGGDRFNVAHAVQAAQDMADDADILDIGGESTRPGADTVPETEEIRRVVPVIKAIRDAGIETIISIDTRKSAVADAALQAGANIINDVSAGSYDDAMFALAAEKAVPICLMHALGDPKTMQKDPKYQDVCREVYDYLRDRIALAEGAGIKPSNIIADPGIGFGKNLDHNLELLSGLSLFHALGVTILLGASRKRFIGTLGNAQDSKKRMAGSVAVGLHGLAQGAHILRVHDVFETRQALALWYAIGQRRKNFDG